MIDHCGLYVRSYERSLEFYSRVFGTLGMRWCAEVDPRYLPQGAPTDPPRSEDYVLVHPLAGMGTGAPIPGGGPKPQFWFTFGGDHASPVRISFEVAGSDMVRRFHTAAIQAGATDVWPPAARSHAGRPCFSASVHDLDRNEIELLSWGER